VPFSPDRFQRLCDLKGVKQTMLAELTGLSQPKISDCNRGIRVTVETLELLATALDCTTDFLLGRHPASVDESDDLFRAVVSRMAFDVFDARLNVSVDHKARCRRVLGHPRAPISADAWLTLAEQIQLAIGPADGGAGLHVVHGNRS
jgi:transcriptional regulator with XRE-family HTH domain